MTYTLILGDPAYSSWSLRAWLLFDRFGLPVTTKWVQFHSDLSVSEQLPEYPTAKTVPTLVATDGSVMGDSLALAEELATRHPDAGFWPDAPVARATARNLAAEMHSGYGALRTDCPMNLRCAFAGYHPSDAVQTDIDRIQFIWNEARARYADAGPWLCGTYSIADAFFAPIAARFTGYGIPLDPVSQAYVDAHLNDPSFVKWRAMGLTQGPDLKRYAKPFDQVAWPALSKN
jgi:glutathione S-transferase